MEALFWICALLVAYPYAIYPVLLVAFNRLGGRRVHVADVRYEPTVTIIMPVHNEARRIGAKVENLLSLDYPRDKMQILVIGDGCTDDSLERAIAAGQGLVTVVPLQGRGGKAAGLNAGLERATGEIIVFTDAGILLDRPSLRNLVGHFTDPDIGCVSGEDYIEGLGDRRSVRQARVAAATSKKRVCIPLPVPADVSMASGVSCASRSAPAWRRTSCPCSTPFGRASAHWLNRWLVAR